MLDIMKNGKHTIDYEKLGERIRSKRKALNITQEILSEKAEVSTAFIGAIERAKSKLSVETLMRICKVLGVTPNYLLMGVEKDYPTDDLAAVKNELYRCSESKREMILEVVKLLADLK